jgi:hypothetical protein
VSTRNIALKDERTGEARVGGATAIPPAGPPETQAVSGRKPVARRHVR